MFYRKRHDLFYVLNDISIKNFTWIFTLLIGIHKIDIFWTEFNFGVNELQWSFNETKHK